SVADAEAVAKTLVEVGFKEENIIKVINEEATRQNIQDLLKVELSRLCDKDDRLLVYFAGHGKDYKAPDGEKMGYLLPVDIDPDYLQSRGISMDEIRKWNQLIPAKHILYIIDSCYSGLAATRSTGLPPERNDYIKEVTNRKVRQIITAGRKDQKSIEKDGHGVFTRMFLRALRGDADLHGRGLITGSDLGNYLKHRVYEESRRRQQPLFRYLEGDGEFLVIPEDKESSSRITTFDKSSKKSVGVRFSEIDFKALGKRKCTLDITTKGEGKVLPAPGKHEFNRGEKVEIKANAAENWKFSRWQGDIERTESEKISVVMDSEKKLEAIFERNKYSLDLEVEGQGEVIIKPDKEKYEEKEKIEVKINPEKGWKFSDLNLDEEYNLIDNKLTFTIDQDISLKIIFSRKKINSQKSQKENAKKTVANMNKAEVSETAKSTVNKSSSFRKFLLFGVILAVIAGLGYQFFFGINVIASIDNFDGYIVEIEISPNNELVAFGTSAGDVNIWDMESKEIINTFDDHDRGVNSVAFSNDGELIVSGSTDGTSRVWDINTGEVINVFREHNDFVSEVDFSPVNDLIVSASGDGTAKVWHPDGTILTNYKAHENSLQTVSFSNEGDLIVSGAQDNTAHVWETRTGETVSIFDNHDNYVNTAVFSPDDSMVVSGGWDKTTQVWDASTGEHINTLSHHDGTVWNLSFTPEGNQILVTEGSGNEYGSVKILNFNDDEVIEEFTAHDAAVYTVDVSSDGEMAATGCKEGVAKIWKWQSVWD
ncbi:MAG: InlB B-repeat-containing protein, partial [bacterium]